MLNLIGARAHRALRSLVASWSAKLFGSHVVPRKSSQFDHH